MATDCNNTLAIREATCKAATDLTDMITGGVNDTSTNYGSKSILGMVKDRTEGASPFFGVDYVWVDSTERTSQTGMVAKEFGYQTNTNEVYRYNGTSWVLQTTFKIVSLDSLTGAVGSINSPLLDLDLQNKFNFKTGIETETFTRSTTGTYTNRYGIVQTASIDEPRFEKDGLLIEGSSTNLQLYSNDLTFWEENGTATATQGAISPDGTANAWTIAGASVSTNSSGTNNIRGYQISLTDGVVYSVSGWVRNKTSGDCYIRCAWATSDNQYVYSNSTEWTRISLTFTKSGTDAGRIILYNSEGKDFEVFGFQVEALPIATSYIPTTSSAVVRSADNCYIDGITFAKQDKLSIYVECTFKNYVNFNHAYSIHYTAGAVEWAGLRPLKTSSIAVNYSYGGAYTSFSHANTFNRRYVTVMDGISNKQYFNGSLIAQESLGNSYVIPDSRLYLGRASASNTYLYGHVKNIKIYNKILTATEVALLG